MLDLDKAKEELAESSYREIQVKTAWTWASRACVAYSIVVSAEPEAKLAPWTLADEYAHEAIEHAALVEDNGKVLEEVRKSIQEFRDRADLNLKSIFSQTKDPIGDI